MKSRKRKLTSSQGQDEEDGVDEVKVKKDKLGEIEETLLEGSRPSRRAKTNKVDYRKLNAGEAYKIEEGEFDDDDEDAANLIDELLDDDEFMVRKGGRTAFKYVNKDEILKSVEESYEETKDRACCICSRQMEKGSKELDSSSNLFEDKLNSGKQIYDVFRAVVKKDLRPSYSGSRICRPCVLALEKVDAYYRDFRRATEHFQDLFELGQKALDADLMGYPNTELVRAGVANIASLGKVTVKLIDPVNDVNFNALSVGFDFNLQVSKSYSASVVPTQEIPPEAVDDRNDGDSSQKDASVNPSTDGTITLVFDQDTGTIEQTTTSSTPPPGKSSELLSSAELPPDSIEPPRSTQLYMTPAEFRTLKTRRVDKGSSTVYLSLEEMETVCERLLLGHRIKQQVMLSAAVAAEYQKQLPGNPAPFTCSDCAASYPYLHLLSNHVQSFHKEDDPEESENTDKTQATAKLSIDFTNKCKKVFGVSAAVPAKTTEYPTLDKPFQCKHCNKCFSDYVTMKEHVEHYHGYSRTCNIEGCGKTLYSLSDFGEHYVKHADSNYDFPKGFEAKKKITLPCPMCNIKILGLWKYVQHSFVHDAEARFACPVCDKRIIKVQNFRDHIMRHQLSPDTQTLAPTTALQVLKKPSNSASNLEDKNRGDGVTVEGTNLTCTECGRHFANAVRLEGHMACHMPKEDWSHNCPECKAPFPNEQRLKLHLANVHSNAGIRRCDRCNAGPFANRHLLQVHMAEEHNEEEQQEVVLTVM